jgi:Double-GTPase 2
VPIESEAAQCQNKECRVSETGKCIEGFVLEKCPHFVLVAVATSTLPPKEPSEPAHDEARPRENAPRTLRLSSGDCLSLEQASSVARASETRVFAIIGPTSSGKTSLIASLYQLFQNPPSVNFRFVRSRTLRAFERASHDARAASRRNEPESETTPHTTQTGGVTFYHLGLRNARDASLLDFELADRTGREYSSAADDPSIATGFLEVKRANDLTLLVDGDRLMKARHDVQSELQMILQGLVDGDATRSSQTVHLVLTKLDAVRRAGGSASQRAEQDFEGFFGRIQRLFAGSFLEIHQMKVAASPKSNILPPGYGVPELLNHWAGTVVIPHVMLDPLPKPSRFMSRFSLNGL